MLTGVDLLKWQLRIAAGEPLTLAQKDIRRSGAVIECRINAEDGHRGFIPSPGKIESFKVPGGFGVRWDSHIGVGSTISPKYDSLIGKLIVHKPTREEAIRCMVRCLEEFEIGPIKTTIPFYSTLCQHARFISSDIDTGFIERQFGI